MRVLFSDNCFGFRQYQYLSREYDNPFVNLDLAFYQESVLPVFTKIAEDKGITLEPEFLGKDIDQGINISYAGYPIYCPHFRTWKEFKSAWDRRKARLRSYQDIKLTFKINSESFLEKGKMSDLLKFKLSFPDIRLVLTQIDRGLARALPKLEGVLYLSTSDLDSEGNVTMTTDEVANFCLND